MNYDNITMYNLDITFNIIKKNITNIPKKVSNFYQFLIWLNTTKQFNRNKKENKLKVLKILNEMEK